MGAKAEKREMFVTSPQFYRTIVLLSVPIILQQLLRVSVDTLDSIMLGRIDQVQMSAVSQAQQIFFIFYTVCSGFSAGCSVLIAQYWGRRDTESIKTLVAIGVRSIAVFGVLAGMESFSSGTVELNGHDIKGKNVHEIRQMGLAYIPEDRMQYGCAGDMSIRDNIIADRYFKKEYRNGLFINHKHIDEIVDQYIKDFEIACDDKREPVRMLSGGNIQKVVVAREFTSGSNFILANQPTRGIDVGAAEMIRKTIVKKSREEGTATLLISADLNEVLECSDRLLVMRKGKVVAAFRKANEVSEEELGEYMLGLKTMTPEEMEGLL